RSRPDKGASGYDDRTSRGIEPRSVEAHHGGRLPRGWCAQRARIPVRRYVMVKSFRWSALALVVTILLAACSTVEDAASLEAQKKKASAAPATYLIVNQGTLASNLPAVASANRDQVRSFYPEAGFASVVTANPNAYRRFGTV